MELYDEELHCEPWRAGIETLALLEEATTLEPPEMVKRVQAATARILKRGRVPVVIGGEHSITIGVVGAVKESYPELSVLQLDAHADLRDTYQQSPFNHACVARRISELCPLVQVGVRSLSAEEAEFLKKVQRDRRGPLRGGLHYNRPGCLRPFGNAGYGHARAGGVGLVRGAGAIKKR
jgi:agmatinase